MKKLLQSLLLIGFVSISAAAAPIVWVANRLDRVSPMQAAGSATNIALFAARGETVSSQIVVSALGTPLSNVNMNVSALTGPPGSIPAAALTFYREYYVTVNGTANYGGGSNPPLGSGTYAEPLIPFVDPETGAALKGPLLAVPASVAVNQNQPFWLDIAIPRGAAAAPGTYTGSVAVTSDQGNVSVPVSLTVWNFELPLVPSESSEWTLWNPAPGNSVTTLALALMRNGVMSRYVNAGDASTEIAMNGLNRSGLDGYSYVESSSCGSYPAVPTVDSISGYAANFPKALSLDLYVGDELNGCPGSYPFLKSIAANAHAAGVKTIATYNAIDANLQGAIDHWVLLKSQQQWPNLPYSGQGDLWSYNSCNTASGNTPEWMVDYPPLNERIQAGFLNAMEGASGILYYRADGWNSGNALGSWDNLNKSSCGTGSGPGDGIFLYPPAPIGSSESAPGIRIKAIRDGINDYGYVQLLKNAGQGSFITATLAPIAASWTNFTKSTAAIEAARLLLGAKLDSLSPKPTPPPAAIPTPATSMAAQITSNPLTVVISWTASSTSGATYNVNRAATAAGPFVGLNSSAIVGSPYTDAAVLNGKSYCYEVTAQTGGGTGISDPVGPVCVTTPPAVTPPPPPPPPPPSPLSITTKTLPNGPVGVTYSATIVAAGGTPPYRFTGSNLAPGLSISTSGQITGKPTAAGMFSESFQIQDSSVPALMVLAGYGVTIAPAVTPPPPPPTSGGFWTATTAPANKAGNDSQSVELGLKFSSKVAAHLSGVRVYCATNSSGTHSVHLWSSSGTSLATASMPKCSGWTSVSFSAPIALTAGATYVVSYHTTQYPWNSPFFNKVLTVGNLTAPVNAGVYKYGSLSAFPTTVYQSTNYWLDVLVTVP